MNITGAVDKGEYLRYYVGDTRVSACGNSRYPLRMLEAISIQNFKVAKGEITIPVARSGTATIETHFITIGETYRLKSNDMLSN